MATQIQKNPKRKDITPEEQLVLQGVDPEEVISVLLTYHNTGIEWDRTAKTITVKVGEFQNGYKTGDDEPLVISTEVQPPDPPEDEIDPVTEEVIRAAGSVQKQVPKLGAILNQNIPPALQNQTTYGDLLRNMIKANDLLLRLLRPEYEAGTNVDDVISNGE